VTIAWMYSIPVRRRPASATAWGSCCVDMARLYPARMSL
jgi:hypothetical protein